jgi:hypothetical protein
MSGGVAGSRTMLMYDMIWQILELAHHHYSGMGGGLSSSLLRWGLGDGGAHAEVMRQRLEEKAHGRAMITPEKGQRNGISIGVAILFYCDNYDQS